MATPKILLVEDLQDDVFFFKRSFKRAGVSADMAVAMDGAKAIEYLTQNGDHIPEIIFLDIKMPNQNGFEVLEWLKKNPKLAGIRVFMLTASAEPQERELAMRLGADDYFLKPLSAEQLRTALERASTQDSRH